MTPGDVVVYLADPLLFGRMVIIEARDGQFVCEAVRPDPDGSFARERFGAHELELASAVRAVA